MKYVKMSILVIVTILFVLSSCGENDKPIKGQDNKSEPQIRVQQNEGVESLVNFLESEYLRINNSEIEFVESSIVESDSGG
tara:strand:- start:1717 stop:1959 length:243 start_codon:yes stop_codon:yes gene_type:complete